MLKRSSNEFRGVLSFQLYEILILIFLSFRIGHTKKLHLLDVRVVMRDDEGHGSIDESRCAEARKCSGSALIDVGLICFVVNEVADHISLLIEFVVVNAANDIGTSTHHLLQLDRFGICMSECYLSP